MNEPDRDLTALAVSSESEKAAVLDTLIASDGRLGRRAERAAQRRLAEVAVHEVAAAVADALLALDQGDLAANAGRTRYGYVEPTEAAWWLLEQTVEPWLEDVARRARLGLDEPARRLGLGILQGLDLISDQIQDDDLLVSWAPDFPGETADSVLRILADVGVELTGAELASVAANRPDATCLPHSRGR